MSRKKDYFSGDACSWGFRLEVDKWSFKLPLIYNYGENFLKISC